MLKVYMKILRALLGRNRFVTPLPWQAWEGGRNRYDEVLHGETMTLHSSQFMCRGLRGEGDFFMQLVIKVPLGLNKATGRKETDR